MQRTPEDLRAISAQQLLDHLMNDEATANRMSDYISERMNRFAWVNFDNILVENTPEYDMYYALTAEFHARVLAESILQLVKS